ncbi:MAG: sulfotransferase [Planctomycetes bacterium]|nr:sulfotransferase [Planctomycetota bacterium]
MKILIQGMRRSSTTFLFDVLCADGRCRGYYEPLAKAQKQARGGGSRVREDDFFAALRAARDRFLARHPLADPSVLNYGAPRAARLELEEELPEEVLAYLRFLLSEGEHCVLKFVRAFRKVSALARLSDEARLLHIVRDPRAVASSFLFGKGRKHAAAFTNAADFFAFLGDPAKDRVPGPRQLQALDVANALIERGLTCCAPDAPVFMKLLALWEFHFLETDRAGRAAFGERYLLLRSEDLVREPESALVRVYGLLGEPVPERTRQWTLSHVEDRPQVFAPDDAAWARAVDDLGLAATLAAAGYA